MSTNSQTQAGTGEGPGGTIRRMIATNKRLAGLVGAVAILALVGTAYTLGEPAGPTTQASHATAGPQTGVRDQGVVNPQKPAVAPDVAVGDGKNWMAGGEGSSGGPGTPASATDGVQIVKTGSMTLEVSSIDSATAQAQAAIEGMGGYIASSNRYGSGDDAAASLTFRLPVTRWDDALKAMRALGLKVVSETTGTQNVTSQVVDLDARITNLKATETALLGIMTKATEIKDILAVQDQLTQTRGQIEQLTAQRDYLKDQAAMSTLSVALILPAKTVTTQATNEWELGKQVDQAVAALVRIGQGLATIGVWFAIVFLPLAGGLLVLWIVYRIGRRVTRRSQAA